MPTTPDVAWLAGLIDGEGCFGCWVQDYSDGRVAVLPRLAVSLRYDDIETLRRAQQIAGGIGSILRRDRKAQGCNPQAVWTVSGRRDCAALAETLALYPPQSKKAFDYSLWLSALAIYDQFKRGGRNARAQNAPLIAEIRNINNQMQEGRKYHDP